MLGWLQTWKESHADTRFFRRAPQYSGGFFALYLLSIYLVFSVINTALFATRTLPQWTSDSEELWWDLQKNWPENVSAELSEDTLQLEGAEELTLPLPQHLANRYGLPSNFALLSESISSATQSATPAAIIAVGDGVGVWNPDGSYRQEPWSILELENLVLNKRTFTEQEPAFREAQRIFGWSALIAFFLLSWLGLLALRLISLIFYAWVGQTLLWLSGNRLRYGSTYKIGMFLLPIAEEIILAVKILYPHINVLSFWLIWFVLLTAIAFTNQRQLGSAE